MHRLRTRDLPDAAWRCCAYWQRALSHKFNSREFATRLDVRVPDLYWYGWRMDQIPWASLPRQFVVRPSFGPFTRGVHVFDGEREVLRDRALSKAALQALVRKEQGPVVRRPLLIEEFVRTEDGRHVHPVEYKFYAFGGDIAAIHVIDRVCVPGGRYWFFTPEWTPQDVRLNTLRTLAEWPIDPPACYPEMRAAARRIGRAYETFVRIDFHASDKGAVFNEFAPTPHLGRGYTDDGQRFLGEWWARVMPERT